MDQGRCSDPINSCINGKLALGFGNMGDDDLRHCPEGARIGKMPCRLSMRDYVCNVVLEQLNSLLVMNARCFGTPQDVRIIDVELEVAVHLPLINQRPRTLSNLLRSPLEVKLGKDETLVAEKDMETRLGADFKV